MISIKTRLACALVLVFAACGDDDGMAAGADAAVGPTVDADTAAADADVSGYITLAEGSWTIPPGGDTYYCIYKTITEEMYVKKFKPIIPQGTHHTVLTIYEGNQPDGIVPCGAGTNGQRMIYGSGVGSPEFEFPAGVGLHLVPGDKILVNLHLYNASESDLSGTSGTLVQTVPAAEVQHDAEIVLAGPVNLNIPVGMHTQTGNCQVSNIASEPIHVFAIAMHMHKTGVHLKSEVIRGGQSIATIQDLDYDFDSQSFTYLTPEFTLMPGDQIKTTCSYNNTTGATINFGDSSDNEMCFTDIFYYPAQGANFICPF